MIVVACQGVCHQVPLVRGAYAPPALRASAWSSASSLISSGVISAAASFSLSGSSRRLIQRDSTRPATSARASGPPCRAASARNSASRRSLPQIRAGASDPGSAAPRTQACAARISAWDSASGGMRSSIAQPALPGVEREREQDPLVTLRRHPSAGAPRSSAAGRLGGPPATRRATSRDSVSGSRNRREPASRTSSSRSGVARRVAEDPACSAAIGLVAPDARCRRRPRRARARPGTRARSAHPAAGDRRPRARPPRRRRDRSRAVARRCARCRPTSALVASSMPRIAASPPAASASNSSTTLRASVRSSLQLRLRQRRSHRGDDVLVAGLDEHDHVGVALDDDRLLAARDRGAREVQAVERRALLPERALGRVDVLRAATRRAAGAGPRTRSGARGGRRA